jgi:hypothetical protein
MGDAQDGEQVTDAVFDPVPGLDDMLDVEAVAVAVVGVAKAAVR